MSRNTTLRHILSQIQSIRSRAEYGSPMRIQEMAGKIETLNIRGGQSGVPFYL